MPKNRACMPKAMEAPQKPANAKGKAMKKPQLKHCGTLKAQLNKPTLKTHEATSQQRKWRGK